MNIIPGRKAASVKALLMIKDVTLNDAIKIREVWQFTRNRLEARAQIDKLLDTHGVEYLGTHKRTGNDVYYCNAGDTYASTVLFAGDVMRVGCWGDLVERNAVREPKNPY